MDYSTLGLKVGIEIHQQLSTGKLFCSCPCELEDEHHREFIRRLRPTQSEMGEVDRAALEEAERNLQFRYQSVSGSCLVEADEEPPHDANHRAIEAALEVSMLLQMTPVDEVHFMRKIVIDGSNTGGFQRTALVSANGHMDVSGRSIGIATLCLEEDAARKISEHGSEVVYRLDRLGIPLVEIATAPDISTPEEVRLVAERLGAILRATKKVRRGIGTIREDLNISISGGARVEIKGAQDLRMLHVFVEEEVRRQVALLEVKNLLRERGVVKAEHHVKDLTGLLRGTKCKVLRGALDSGGKVVAVKLPGFAGTLGPTKEGVKRLGPELAAHARVAGVKGLFHSDELPGYGITNAEVEDISATLDAQPQDAFLLVADSEPVAIASLARAVDRANVAIDGVPEETRDPLPDGRTVYSRPLPGKERMYPETDVRPILVNEKLIESIRLNLPELPEHKSARFVKDFGISRNQADALVKAGCEDEFELLAGSMGNPGLVARIYLNILPELEKQGLDPSRLSLESVKEVLEGINAGTFAKEAVPEVLSHLLRYGYTVAKAAEVLGLGTIDISEVRSICERVVRERESFIRERKEASLGPLMGIVMKELRGRVDGKIISEVLSEKIAQLLQ